MEEELHLDSYMDKFFSIFYFPSLLIEEKYNLVGDDIRWIRKLNYKIQRIKEKRTKYIHDMMVFHHLKICETKNYRIMTYEYKWMKKYYDILEVIRRRDKTRDRYFSLHPYNMDYLIERGYIKDE
jgi:hypothetical protein